MLIGSEYDIYVKMVINVSGFFTDEFCKLLDDKVEEIMMFVVGVYLMFLVYYCLSDFGFIILKIKDGRVVFVFSWLGACIVGIIDIKCDVMMMLLVMKDEVDFILELIVFYLKVEMCCFDILSVWSGIRLFAVDSGVKNIENMFRDYVIVVEKDGMVIVIGGKWMIYR